MALLSVATVALVLMQQSVGEAVVASEQKRLEACIAKIETAPEDAYEEALTWSYQGNRPAARQCLALAMVANGRPDEGAARLEQLANARDGGTLDQRGIYLIQAGHAWLQAGAPEAAIVTFTNALKLSPGNPELLVDRATAQVFAENTDAAMTDLNAALKGTPNFVPALQMRAELRLDKGELDAAFTDVKTAMAAEPENIETLVLRGQVREAIRVKSGK